MKMVFFPPHCSSFFASRTEVLFVFIRLLFLIISDQHFNNSRNMWILWIVHGCVCACISLQCILCDGLSCYSDVIFMFIQWGEGADLGMLHRSLLFVLSSETVEIEMEIKMERKRKRKKNERTSQRGADAGVIESIN